MSVRSTSGCISKPSSVRRSGIAITLALFTRMSTRGRVTGTRSAAARTEATDARSSGTTSSDAVCDSARISSTAPVAFAWFLTAITTWAPLSASALVVSRPRPPLAPVTTAASPIRSGIESRV
jgi:hypothetical protein